MAIGPDFLSFVRQHIRSVWTVELLLLLRSDRTRAWESPELVRELRASRMLVNDNLRRLEAAGLVIREDHHHRWRYRPAAPALDELCGLLEKAYRERPVALLDLIARPTDPIQSLADAFKFPGGGNE
ncbi:MAG TPA: hypothetical protein VH353_01560 [Caulobacteraceae bacterium]|nr:hypothetical protein [Caulobacteraceae bacterium]